MDIHGWVIVPPSRLEHLILACGKTGEDFYFKRVDNPFLVKKSGKIQNLLVDPAVFIFL